MIPKLKLFALLVVFIAAGGFAATGAFTTVEAERTADVNVAGDANALLAIQPIPDPDDSDFIGQAETTDQTFQIVLDDGVNARASTTAENLFNITNNGQEPVDVWIATQGGAQENNASINTSFYIRSEQIVGDGGDVGGNEIGPSQTGGNSYEPLITDIDTYTAFIEGNEETGPENTDIVISEVEGDGSENQEPGEATVVSIAPGDSIRVSLAIEIEGEADELTNDDGEVLNNIVIFAIGDNESGSIRQDLATNPGNGNETKSP